MSFYKPTYMDFYLHILYVYIYIVYIYKSINLFICIYGLIPLHICCIHI